MPYRFLTALAFFFSLTFSLSAQSYLTEKDVSGKTLKLYEEARQHINAVRNTEALEALEKALQREPTFIDAQLMYGDLNLQMKRYAQAEEAFEKGLALGPDYAPLAYYLCAQSEFAQQKFEEAVGHLGLYLQSDKARGNRKTEAERLQASASLASNARNHPVPFDPHSLGPGVNTDLPEYLPSLTADGEKLVFVRVVGRQEDFYLSQKKDGQWQEAIPLENINHPQLSEGAQSIAANGKAIVFTACERKDGLGRCDLYITEMKNGQWQEARNLGSPINTRGWESQPSLSADGNTLYFVSDRQGGQGLIDIWSSKRDAAGKWGTPQNLGPAINTPEREQAPFIHPDGRTLYFMSDGHPGLGGFDLYLSRLQPDGSWGKPQNLGYPINTDANEGALIVSLDGQTAYFSTDRSGVVDSLMPEDRKLLRRSSDIYSFELYPEVRPQPATYVKAIVREAGTRRPLIAGVDFVELDNGRSYIQSQTDEDGEFLVVLPMGEDYALHVNKPGYLFHSENFALSQAGSLSEPFLLEIELSPIPEPASETTTAKPVILKNVFFETGSAALRPESATELNRLKELLEENPELKIRINGHTDNVGSEEDNQVLSENRAKAVYDFLVEKGIGRQRLRFKGYGESKPIATNETAEGRQLNRRTEFEAIRE
ncbi:MAG: PD40 domain-containing protein [Lewinellaceae bacterium]|nr:PD40 domain-containing protein [Lewinellaceae bacterium]